MEGVLKKYKSSKFTECLKLLEEIIEEEDLLGNLVKQNCIAVLKCLITVYEDDIQKTNQMQQYLYKNYQIIVSPSPPGVLIPLQLELTAFFNFLWWSLYYVNYNKYKSVETKGYLSSIQRGLRRVLGISCKTSNHICKIEDILHDIRSTKKNLEFQDYFTVCLTSEILVLLLAYILKIDNSTSILHKCLETVNVVIDEMELLITALNTVRDYEDLCPLYENLFKFGFLEMNSTVSNLTTSSIEGLYMVKATCLFMLKKYDEVLLVIKKNMKSEMKPIQCYLAGLTALMLNDFNQCLGLVLMSSRLNIEGELNSRLNILHGQLLSKKGDANEALSCFKHARRISPNIAAAYYYMGEEYGKLESSDEMINCFNDLIKVKSEQFQRRPFSNNFETVILDLLHPTDEITEAEAVYAAAVTYGLLDRLQESTEMFEKYIEIFLTEGELKMSGDRIIKTPSIVTIFHEASTMNILTGNFTRSEFLLSKAVSYYSRALEDSSVKATSSSQNAAKELHGVKSNKGGEEQESVSLFSEDQIYFFEEDVIALMLSAEMENTIQAETYKTTLAKIITTFSKYLNKTQKKETTEGAEKLQSLLVNALSAKTCLNIAKYQIINGKSPSETERIFRRGLICNPGDSDVLYEYCKYLLGVGKSSDAWRLWKNFSGKTPVLVVDQCQSLALRFLLRTSTPKRQMKKMETELESASANIHFDIT